MFEDYTAEALLEDVLQKAPDGIDTRKGSIFYDAVSGIIEQIAKMYTDLDQVFNYVFISTTSGEYLDQKASEYGITRNLATAAKYYLVYEGTTPDVGARFFHNDTGLYFTVEELETDDGTVLLLVAEETGTDSNSIVEGDLAVPVNTINGLTSSTFGAVYEYGTDDETDDSLRARMQEKIAGPAENGNKQHYKTWCESVTGVGVARIFPLWTGPNTVKGVLIDTEGKPCTDAIVAEVQDYIDPADKGMTVTIDEKTYTVGDGLGNGVANIGAHFTAVSANALAISVTFNAELASGYTASSVVSEATEAIEQYIQDLVLNAADDETIIVRISAIGALLSDLDSLVDYSDLKLNGGTDNITPDDDDVPVLSEVVIDVG